MLAAALLWGLDWLNLHVEIYAWASEGGTEANPRDQRSRSKAFITLLSY
ncbi:hypothetical protein PSP6_480005 [Paraburkholderia tropica]|nr:hypothetical protein PSP6_480005 [Paraburkholderia tropica]